MCKRFVDVNAEQWCHPRKGSGARPGPGLNTPGGNEGDTHAETCRTRNRRLATSAAAAGALLLLQHSPSGLDGDDGKTIPITRLVSRVTSLPQSCPFTL